MKKILYIVSNPFAYTQRSVGGNISSANGVIKSFRDKGYELDILSDDFIPGLENKLKGINFIFLPFSKLRFYVSKLSNYIIIKNIFSKLENFIFQKIIFSKVKNLLKNNKYEYFYIRASFHTHVISQLIKKNKIKLILEVNKPLSMTPFNKDSSGNWPKNKKEVIIPKAEKIQYDIAKIITVDSSLRAKWIIDFVGDYKNKILINHNGVDFNKFQPTKKDFKILKSLGLMPNDIIVGMASSFRWYNDLIELFKIIRATLLKNNNIKFLLISGDKIKANLIYSYIKKYKLLNSVKLVQQIPFKNMPKILNLCDICLSHFNFHKKWPHNCSIKHLEYLSLSKPVVATNVGEVNFAIENGINGYLCEEGRIDEYVEAIINLAKKPNLRESFGIAGRNKAILDLNWDKNVQRILSFHAKLDKSTNL
mgnify:CR=1 FL=1